MAPSLSRKNYFLLKNHHIILRTFATFINKKWYITHPMLDLDYLLDDGNIPEIQKNILKRRSTGDITLIHSLKNKLKCLKEADVNFNSVKEELDCELLKIPNKTHCDILLYEDEPKIISKVNQKRHFDYKPLEFHEIIKRLNLARTEHLGNLSGNRGYFLLGELADLENALLRYIIKFLLMKKFNFIAVPDILPRHIIESCGMNTRGDHTQVYTLDPYFHGLDLCLSGTSEMALAGYHSNKVLNAKELPLKLAAISRCYRAEVSNTAEERGMYRVHEFMKVEMFVVSLPYKSDGELEQIRQIQEDFLKKLELHYQVLDMPAHELGNSAYRKYDIEAWMPGKQMYGELSSCSNCTDYQSNRLNIKYHKDVEEHFCHTLNGTACAIPRLLIALIENGQNKNGTISIPRVLQEYMNQKTHIGKQKNIPSLKLIKYK